MNIRSFTPLDAGQQLPDLLTYSQGGIPQKNSKFPVFIRTKKYIAYRLIKRSPCFLKKVH